MWRRLMTVSFIILTTFPVLPQVWATEQDAAGQAYRAAYKLILDEKYPEAIQALQAFLEKHGSSDMSDDARFWICFAREKTEPSAEKSFECYQSFIQSNPKSRWAKDAKMNMVRIAHQLAREGKPQYEQQVRPFEAAAESEIQLTVLAALLDMGDAESLTKVLERVESIPNEEMRSKLIRMLGDHAGSSPAVLQKLSDFARKDPSVRVRTSAIRAIADVDSREAFAFVRDVAASGDSLEVRKAALRALSDMDAFRGEAIPFLKSTAATDSNLELAMMAVRALGDIESREATAALQQVYDQSKNAEVRRAALRAIADSAGEGKDAVAFLLKVAASDSDPEIRRSAVSSLSDIESPEAFNALRDLALSGQGVELRESALRALGDRSDDKAVEALTAFLKSEKDSRLRRSAIRALGEAGKDSAVAVLEQAARMDPDAEVRTSAVRALRDIGSPAARQALVRLLGIK